MSKLTNSVKSSSTNSALASLRSARRAARSNREAIHSFSATCVIAITNTAQPFDRVLFASRSPPRVIGS